MKIGICIKGLEDVAAEEVKGKKIANGRVSFEGDVKDFRSLKAVYELKEKFKFKNKSEIIRKTAKLNFKGSFMIICNREGEQKFNSGWVISELNEKLKQNRKIDYKNPKNIVFVDIIDNECFYGFLIKKDMHKRVYRIRLRGSTVHPCVAYSMLKLIDYKKNESFLDPRCGDGVIAIEAALLGGKKVYGVDRNIMDARVNAKVAKVDVTLTEELKIKKAKKIATYLPSVSKHKRENMISGIYERFFKDIRKILDGKMAILVGKKDLIKKFAKGFKLIEERKIFVGGSEQHILVFE